jgi:hypothetical protein
LQLFSFFHLVQFSILCHFRLYLVTVLDHHKQFPNVCHLPNPFSLKLCITSSDVFTFIVRSLRSDFYTYLFQFSLLYLFKQVFTQLLTPSKFPFLPFYLFTYCYQLSRWQYGSFSSVVVSNFVTVGWNVEISVYNITLQTWLSRAVVRIYCQRNYLCHKFVVTVLL